MPEPEERRLENAPFFASRRDGRAAPFAKVMCHAIREAKILRLRYKDRDDTLSDRRVRPLAVWAFSDGWLFAGWGELRNDFRAFRLDRVAALEDTGDNFESGPSQDLQAYLAAKFPIGRLRSSI